MASGSGTDGRWRCSRIALTVLGFSMKAKILTLPLQLVAPV